MEGCKDNADIRPSQKIHRAKAQVVHENLPRLRSKKRGNRGEMPKMQGQKPALEETGNSEVTFFTFPFQFRRAKMAA
jgi:hypothetical protein